MWLIGMMGSGKSTIGAFVAERLQIDFFDTDQMVATRAERSIAQIWDEQGEAGFRQLESDVVASVPAQGSLVAAGGGAVLETRNRVIMAATPPVVWLQARPETLFERVGALGGRPLLDSPDRALERMRQILSNRFELYEEVATHRVPTDDRDVEAVVNEVMAIWQA